MKYSWKKTLAKGLKWAVATALPALTAAYSGQSPDTKTVSVAVALSLGNGLLAMVTNYFKNKDK